MNGERIAFENWLGIKPCGAAHDLAWAAWKARAALRPDQAGVPDDIVKDAERYRWLRATTNWASSKGERIDVRNNPELWDSAIDAAMLAAAPTKDHP